MPQHIKLINNKMTSDFNIQDLTLKKGYFSGSFLFKKSAAHKAYATRENTQNFQWYGRI